MSIRRHRSSAAITSIAYLTLALATVSFTRFDGGVAFLWIASAFLIARLMTLPKEEWYRHLLGCTVSSAVATACVGLGTWAAFPIAAMNILEAVLAAVLLRQLSIPEQPLVSQRWLLRFVLICGVVAPLTSGIGAAAIATAITGSSYHVNLTRWYTGHALGAITFTPVFTMLMRGDIRSWARGVTRARLAEIGLLLTFVMVTSLTVFIQQKLPLLFLPLLPIILTTFRAGRSGAALCVVILTTVGGGYTLSGSGPISLIDGSVGDRMQFLQFYLAATVLTVMPIAADLARRKHLFQQLRDSEARYRMLAENSTDVILNTDVDGTIRFVSPSVQQLGGYAPSTLVGRNAADLVLAQDRASVRRSHLMALRAGGKMISIEHRVAINTGEERWFETHSRSVQDDTGIVEGVVSVTRDVSARKATEERLSHAALTDPLTQLPNRRAFQIELDAMMEQAKGGALPCCLAVIDFDHFKQVNDEFGHVAGDWVLREFARVALILVRDGDVVARIGGEEFAILLRAATLDQAFEVCERLRAAIANLTIEHEGHAIHVTISGGIAAVHGDDGGNLLGAADAALYEAKRGGRNRLSPTV
jgi:diguanylate cyclase (GGDEF)-like protein/PAS domain S-box-containing protein